MASVGDGALDDVVGQVGGDRYLAHEGTPLVQGELSTRCLGSNSEVHTEPARVKITEVGWVAYFPDLVPVPLTLHNEGGPGFYKVRFYGAQSQVNAPPDWEIETEVVGVVDRGYRATVSFHSRGTGASPLVGISVFSRGLNSENFTR